MLWRNGARSNKNSTIEITIFTYRSSIVLNIEADTNLKNADANNKPLQGKYIEASTSSILQGIENAKAQKTYLRQIPNFKNFQFIKKVKQ